MKRIAAERQAADVLIFASLGALGVSAGVTLFGLGLTHAGAMVSPADVKCCRDCGTLCGCEKFGDRCRCPRPTD